MGLRAQEIVGIDVQELIADLNRAYADEWLAYYAYQQMAQLVSGNLAEEFKDAIEETAKEEYTHASELAARIIALGGTPVKNLPDIEDASNSGNIDIPANSSDIEAIIDTILTAEAGAIEVYQEIAKKTFGMDFVTHALVTDTLSDETRHEDRFFTLKGRTA